MSDKVYINEEIAMEVNVSMALPMGRETIEVWDPIQKCKVIRYKDEIEKELYGHLYKGLFEYGA